MATPDRPMTRAEASIYPSWRSVLLVGFVLWLASVIVTGTTDNVNMIPTVILLGSFLVPVTGVIWYLDHYESPTLTFRLVVYAFIVGGTLGVLMASLAESLLLSDGLFVYFGVGFIEELVKLLALVFVARKLGTYRFRDGIVLGATVGFGFAALESSGYALTALIVPTQNGVGLSLGSLVSAEVLRGILSPVGHGLWTAVVGGVLFHAARNGHLKITGGVVGAYVFVAILHGLWDSMRGIAIILTEILTASRQQELALTSGQRMTPTASQIHLFQGIELAGMAIISIIGFVYLVWEWHRAGRPSADAASASAAS